MSSYWDLTFAVTGDLRRLDELKKELPSLFHRVYETKYNGGVLIAEVSENYGGCTAMAVAIERNPDLTFNGCMVHESAAQGGGHCHAFFGRDGKSEWSTFIVEDDEEDPCQYYEEDEEDDEASDDQSILEAIEHYNRAHSHPPSGGDQEVS